MKEHHKMKESHKMIDNRMVKDDHQEGIERVKQRKGAMEVGQGGRMKSKPEEMANWRRSGEQLTPRKG
jgi:hypothetical protein